MNTLSTFLFFTNEVNSDTLVSPKDISRVAFLNFNMLASYFPTANSFY